MRVSWQSVGETVAAEEPSFAVGSSSCLHCGQPLVDVRDVYCCGGCEAVHQALTSRGLDRFYTLRGQQGTPVAVHSLSSAWLEPIERRLAASEHTQRLAFDVQGLHCSGCVWLIEQLFTARAGAQRVLVNPSVGRLELWVDPDFDLAGFAQELASFGYLLGHAAKRDDAAADGLLLRLAVCVALALNTMVLSAALYLGLDDGRLFELFHQLNFAMGTVSVAVGGSYFITTAWRAARRGIAHLDQPIALGIVAAFAASALAFWRGGQDVYFDTLCVFVALMLGGRWIQERVLSRNRNYLLQDDGIEALPVRRVEDGLVSFVAARELEAGDQLLIAPGDLVPVAAEVADPHARVSLQWIDGEPNARSFSCGDEVPAGAFNASDKALRVTASEAFSASALRDLLGGVRTHGQLLSGAFWERLARWYVGCVLSIAAVAGGSWWIWAGAERALSVATAVLVVTCPCAFGIATPLAYELVLARLRRLGLFVRSADFLDRAVAVSRVVFDKTGTLTTGRLRLGEPEALAQLEEAARDALFQLAVRSSHPKAAAVSAALAADRRRLDPRLEVVEHTGLGVEAQIDGRCWRLGSGSWATREPSSGGEDLVLSRDGQLVLRLPTCEQERPDAVREVRALARAGYDLWMLTGDSRVRAEALARRLRLDPAHVVADNKPAQKAAWLEAHAAQGDTLMLGDGVNDAPAMRVALCGGTPAVDRPLMPARTDFYFVTPGLSPVREALMAARKLRRVVRDNLKIALVYNAGAVALACAGHMAPWLAAVSMPVSSLLVIFWTLRRLPPGAASWKS